MYFESDITVHAAYMNGGDVSLPLPLCYCKNVEMVLSVGQVPMLVMCIADIMAHVYSRHHGSMYIADIMAQCVCI